MATEKLLTYDRVNRRLKEVAVDIGASTVTTEIQKDVTFLFSNEALQVGDAVTLFFPNGLRIDGYAIHSDTAATVELDVRAVIPTSMPSAPEDTVIGTGVAPTLSGEYFAEDNELIGWDTVIPENSVVVARIKTITGPIKNLTFQIQITEALDGFPLVVFTSLKAEAYDYTNPAVLFGASDVEEYPTYTHTTEIERTPELLFGASDVEEYPTYVQAAPVAFIFDAGTNDNVDQWVKYSRTFAPLSGAPVYSYVVTGLPTGLSVSDDGATLTISGIPEVTGTFNVGIEITDRIDRVVSDSYSIIIASANRTPVIENTISGTFAAPLDGYLLGYNFSDTSNLRLFINGVDYTANIQSFTDTEILFTIPSGMPNPADIYVVAFGRTSNTISRNFK